MRLPDGTSQHRRRSLDVPGHAHELTFSCYRGLRLLNKDRTRLWLVDALDRARRKHDLDLWAYVIMPEHAHVLLRPRKASYEMAAILKSIKQSVSRRAMRHLRQTAPEWLERLAVRRSSGRVEHRFWQAGGGYDRNLVQPKAIRTSVEYIHQNPVRRGLVASAAEWPWSSARWYLGQDEVVLEMDPTLPE